MIVKSHKQRYIDNYIYDSSPIAVTEIYIKFLCDLVLVVLLHVRLNTRVMTVPVE